LGRRARPIPAESPFRRELHCMRIRDGLRTSSGSRRCCRLRPGCSCRTGSGPRHEGRLAIPGGRLCLPPLNCGFDPSSHQMRKSRI
jgi:hypothetical protein